MHVLALNDIHRSFEPGVPVLDGVDLNVQVGEVVGLLGRNGAGKTTLLHIAMGMLHQHRGTVSVFGLDPHRQPVEVKGRIGFVSENQNLPSFLKVREVIDLHRSLFQSWDDEMAKVLIERFGLRPGTRIKKLSKGQARQVALLCALCHRPELLLLDEPAGGLDAFARREFLETSIQALSETGTTIVFSSHYLSDVERLASRVLMLHDSKVLIDNSLDELHESFSIALVPYRPQGTSEALLGLPECLGVRVRSDAVHAVFRLDPDEACTLLAERLGITDAVCRTAGLEEMFVEIAGGER
ncbi:MAG: ABC transporter ATP-binding protein [Acidobacteriota bacterium]